MKKYKRLIYAILWILLLVLSLYLMLITDGKKVSDAVFEYMVSIMSLIASCISGVFFFYNQGLEDSKLFKREYKTSHLYPINLRLFDSAYENTSKSKNDNLKSLETVDLIALNRKESAEYYDLYRGMVKNSFFFAILMSILGFILIAVSVIIIYIMDLSLSSAVIPAIGGSIVEVIAGTILIIYKQSIKQLNKYYDTFNDEKRFLFAINLSNKISQEKRDDLYIEIIKSYLTNN